MWVLVTKPLVLCKSSQHSSQLSQLASALSFFPYGPLMDFVHYNGVLHQQNIKNVGKLQTIKSYLASFWSLKYSVFGKSLLYHRGQLLALAVSLCDGRGKVSLLELNPLTDIKAFMSKHPLNFSEVDKSIKFTYY